MDTARAEATQVELDLTPGLPPDLEEMGRDAITVLSAVLHEIAMGLEAASASARPPEPDLVVTEDDRRILRRRRETFLAPPYACSDTGAMSDIETTVSRVSRTDLLTEAKAMPVWKFWVLGDVGSTAQHVADSLGTRLAGVNTLPARYDYIECIIVMRFNRPAPELLAFLSAITEGLIWEAEDL